MGAHLKERRLVLAASLVTWWRRTGSSTTSCFARSTSLWITASLGAKAIPDVVLRFGTILGFRLGGLLRGVATDIDEIAVDFSCAHLFGAHGIGRRLMLRESSGM